ncbi:MAG: DMT family transporter [Burkholderiaceae bacterium]
MSVTAQSSSPPKAVAFALSAALLLPLVDGLVKELVQSYPVLFVAWARFAMMTVFLGVAVVARLGWGVLRPRALGVQLARASSAVVATGLFYAGLRSLPLGESTAIMCLAPALAAGLAHLLFGERASASQWTGIAASLVGAMLVIRPGGSIFTPAVILPFAGSLAFATYILTSRVAGWRDDPRVTTFWTCLGGFLLFSLALPFAWETSAVASSWGMFALIGALGALGQLATAFAYRHGTTTMVAPIGYMSLVVAAVLGFIFFRDAITAITFIGMALIAIGGVLVIRGSMAASTA